MYQKNPQKEECTVFRYASVGSEIHENWKENPGKDPPAIMFFCSGRTLIQSRSLLSCSAAEMRFLLFKGPGSFKKH